MSETLEHVENRARAREFDRFCSSANFISRAWTYEPGAARLQRGLWLGRGFYLLVPLLR